MFPTRGGVGAPQLWRCSAPFRTDAKVNSPSNSTATLCGKGVCVKSRRVALHCHRFRAAFVLLYNIPVSCFLFLLCSVEVPIGAGAECDTLQLLFDIEADHLRPLLCFCLLASLSALLKLPGAFHKLWCHAGAQFFSECAGSRRVPGL